MLKMFFAAFIASCTLLGGLTVSTAHAAGDGYAHHLVLHVDDNDAGKMNLALNNAANVSKSFAAKGEKVQIEIVAYGPGLHMLRTDSSPSFPNVTFAACGNTIKGMTKKEGKAPQIIESDSISVVPSGVVQIMMRQDQGWHYLKP